MALFGSSEETLSIVLKTRDEASKVIKKVEKNVTDFSGRVEKLKPTFQKMAVFGTASFAAIAAGATGAINKARDFEEETNKFNVVFKDVAKEAEAMADTLNKSYGLSQLNSKKLLSSTGDILTGFGFTGKAAIDLSGNLNRLAVDVASFTNAQGGAEAVSAAMTKALLGERESLKTYGIAIQEADVNAELLAQGMSELTGEALRQAKAQVTLDLVYRQSPNAIGDYERSIGSLANTQRELSKTFDDIQKDIGATLAPILNDILQKALPVVRKIQEWVALNPDLARNILIAAAALTVLVAGIGALGLILPPIIAFFALLSPAVIGVGAALAGLGLIFVNTYRIADIFLNHWDEVWAGVKATFFEVWGKIKAEFNKVVGFIIDQIDRVIAMYNRMKSIVTQPIKSIGGAIGGALFNVTRAVGNVFKEHGGIVQAPAGKPVPIIAHGQEQIIPASDVGKGGGLGRGISVVFNNPVVRDDRDIERLREEMEGFFRQVIMNNKVSI